MCAVCLHGGESFQVQSTFGRIFRQLKNLTGHFIHTGSFNNFALSTPNFERLYFRRLRWFRVNRTPKRVNFQVAENSSCACERSLRLDFLSLLLILLFTTKPGLSTSTISLPRVQQMVVLVVSDTTTTNRNKNEKTKN